MSQSAESLYPLLAAALKRRIATIQDHAFRDRDPAGHLKALQEASEAILALQNQLPPNTHPQLRHYLERCSYDKALAFVEEASSANP